MELPGCDAELISQLPRLPRPKVRQIIKNESPEREVTKSLLNLLENIIRVGSVPVSQTQKAYFDKHSEVVLHLLGSRKSIAWKKKVLEEDISLVLNIAASCPAGSSLLKKPSTTSEPQNQ